MDEINTKHLARRSVVGHIGVSGIHQQAGRGICGTRLRGQTLKFVDLLSVTKLSSRRNQSATINPIDK